MKISRRNLLTSGALGGLALASGTAVWCRGEDTSDIQLVETKIGIKNLPAEFQDYRIGFLTDFHLGVYVPTEWVEQSVQMLRAAKVDVLLLGGDFIWLPDRDLVESLYPIRNKRFLRDSDDLSVASDIFEEISRVTSQLNPRDGTYAVLGNHDRWTDPIACVRKFSERNIRVLINEAVIVTRGAARLRLIGVDDYWTGVPEMPKLPQRDRPEEARVLLVHNPDYTSELIQGPPPDIDLALSGHTHGGQVKLPLIGPIHYNIEDQRFREGVFKYQGVTSYTSRGIGVVEIPFRFNCPPEVSVISLISA